MSADTLLRVLVVSYGATAGIVFAVLAWVLARAPLNGDSERQPIMVALSILGFGIAAMWIALSILPFESGKILSRVGIVSITMPTFFLAFGLMRRHWPWGH